MARPWDSPERSRRAQHAQRALPEAGSVPYPSAHSRASSISPPAIRTERDASARRGGAVRSCPVAYPGSLGVPNARDTPSPKPAACPVQRRTAGPARPHRLRSVRSATRQPGGAGQCGAVLWRTRAVSACPTRARAVQAAQVPWAAASPMAQFHEPAGANERTARRSIVHGARTPPGGGPASPTGARTARRAREPGAAARERVLVVCLRWGINSVLNPGRKQRLGGVLGTVGGRHGPCGHPSPARRAPRARRRA